MLSISSKNKKILFISLIGLFLLTIFFFQRKNSNSLTSSPFLGSQVDLSQWNKLNQNFYVQDSGSVLINEKEVRILAADPVMLKDIKASKDGTDLIFAHKTSTGERTIQIFTRMPLYYEEGKTAIQDDFEKVLKRGNIYTLYLRYLRQNSSFSSEDIHRYCVIQADFLFSETECKQRLENFGESKYYEGELADKINNTSESVIQLNDREVWLIGLRRITI